MIGIGDAASSLIGPEFYHEFSAPRTKRYVEAVHNAGGLVRLHICGRTEALAADWKDLKVDMIDVDAGNSLKAIRGVLGRDGAVLAGNLDPVRDVRDSGPGEILGKLSQCEKDSRPSWIVGAGCEIPVDCPEENLKAMENYATGYDK
jgi:uroporphyrinogen-III decarboxylase